MAHFGSRTEVTSFIGKSDWLNDSLLWIRQCRFLRTEREDRDNVENASKTKKESDD